MFQIRALATNRPAWILALLIAAAVSTAGPKTIPAESTNGATGLRDSVLSILYEDSFALVIGINNYDQLKPLEQAIDDARLMEKHLRERGFDVTMLVDQEATRAAILRALDDIFVRATRNDRILVYFSGHGGTAQIDRHRLGYLLPVDADPSDYASTAISMETLRETHETTAAKHVFYIMDCCYSGLLLSRAASLPFEAKKYLEAITSVEARQILTAGTAEQPARDGLFTAYLDSALTGQADTYTDGIITAIEIMNYMKHKVAMASRQNQTPLYGRLGNGAGEFCFLSEDLSALPAELEKTRIVSETFNSALFKDGASRTDSPPTYRQTWFGSNARQLEALGESALDRALTERGFQVRAGESPCSLNVEVEIVHYEVESTTIYDVRQQVADVSLIATVYDPRGRMIMPAVHRAFQYDTSLEALKFNREMEKVADTILRYGADGAR